MAPQSEDYKRPTTIVSSSVVQLIPPPCAEICVLVRRPGANLSETPPDQLCSHRKAPQTIQDRSRRWTTFHFQCPRGATLTPAIFNCRSALRTMTREKLHIVRPNCLSSGLATRCRYPGGALGGEAGGGTGDVGRQGWVPSPECCLSKVLEIKARFWIQQGLYACGLCPSRRSADVVVYVHNCQNKHAGVQKNMSNRTWPSSQPVVQRVLLTPPGEVQLRDVAAEITGRGEASVPTNLGDPPSHMRLQLAVGQRVRTILLHGAFCLTACLDCSGFSDPQNKVHVLPTIHINLPVVWNV
ncbi:hypothetical protein Bbelb_169310 [Branchiostoma belcheri]|nr:hypothetical protein Bbelb_169310 [Branchiostoma belcheri]